MWKPIILWAIAIVLLVSAFQATASPFLQLTWAFFGAVAALAILASVDAFKGGRK